MDKPPPHPPCVLKQLIASTILGIFWKVDLTRPFSPDVLAGDASTEYGFGASILRATPEVARHIARVSDKQGDYMVLDGGIHWGDSPRHVGADHTNLICRPTSLCTYSQSAVPIERTCFGRHYQVITTR